ncbi:hypothetical protein LTR09_006594 [Extremus antarcticus]|uniref:Uncharacterized protein n=1 Tax=Extremus antarcticus TaxID=702011 RepID=A0AAJ0G7R4_9PEZI|nr:hypothetical protein LTR09_006594 [Extremus antarcticus]
MPTPRRPAASPKESSSISSNQDAALLSTRASKANILPDQLHRSVARCAWSCLEDYISQGDQGFTLGELAYICLDPYHSPECKEATYTANNLAYNVCVPVSGAVLPTHTRGLPTPSTTTTPKTVSTTNGQQTASTSPRTTPTAVSPSPNNTPGQHPSSTMAPAPSESGTLTPATAVSGKSNQLPSTDLTNGQAAGVSIAAMGAVMLAIAAVYLVIYIRRRNVKVKDERKDYDFVDEAPPRFSPFNYGYADPRGPLGGFEKRRAELGGEKHMTKWPGQRVSYDDYVAKYNEKSVSITPPESRRSDDGTNNMALQLPAKPPAIVTRGLPKSAAPSPNTATTVFEEDKTPTPAVPRKPLPKLVPAGTAIHYPPPPPSKPQKAQHAGAHKTSPQRNRQPSLSLQIPQQATRAAQLPSNQSFPLPPAGLNIRPSNNQTSNIHSWIPPPPPPVPAGSARNSDNSVLDYYTSPVPGAGYDTSPDIDLPTPVQVAARQRRAHPPVLKVTNPSYPPPRGPRVTSMGSDTSFESMQTDEPTPPEEEPAAYPAKQLTPVMECTSPLAAIRYPKVPRSSNQSVPRSPKQSTPRQPASSPALLPRVQRPARDERVGLPSQVRPQQRTPPPPVTPKRNTASSTSTISLSGSTLAAKRRGDTAALDLERRFYVADSAHSRTVSHATTSHSSITSQQLDSAKSLQSRSTQTTASPLKGYGRVAGRVKPSSTANGLGLEGIIAQSNPGYVGHPVTVNNVKYPGLPRHPRVQLDDASKIAAAEERQRRESLHWEPKLTPSRRGEDLFLSVGVATPRDVEFPR